MTPGAFAVTDAILDGKTLAEQIRTETALEVAEFVKTTGLTPCLATVLVGENQAKQYDSSAARWPGH
jgi:5,10-methylene-tetrahydrofolate dehydrogenase/methenyl tetrahydrofolate cyclohydrolase